MQPGAQPGWATPPTAPNDAKSVAALVLGILCLVGTFCWLGAPLGIPAIVLGAMSHRDIRRSDGMLGGGAMATAGIVMGAIGTLVFTCWVGFLAFAFFKATPTTPVAPPVLPPTAATPMPTSGPALVPPGGWGRIHVVAVHPSAARTLRLQLAEEVRSARTASESLLVETVSGSCAACVEIARAMPEPDLQAALAHVRVVHVDVEEFGLEASALHLNTASLPWFYLVDTRGQPRDGISADEWGDNDAETVAPVLEAFLQGKLRARRQPWGGTPL